MQTMQQLRAKYALEKVQAAYANSNTKKDEFPRYCLGFPSMIHQNGLGAAAAFYYSKEGTHRQVYDILSEWLTKEDQPYNAAPLHEGKKDLLKGITQGSMEQYRLAQAEAQALMYWVKTFAKAYAPE